MCELKTFQFINSAVLVPLTLSKDRLIDKFKVKETVDSTKNSHYQRSQNNKRSLVIIVDIHKL